MFRRRKWLKHQIIKKNYLLALRFRVSKLVNRLGACSVKTLKGR